MKGIFPLSAESTTQSANLPDSRENASNPKLATLNFGGVVCNSTVVDTPAGLIWPRTISDVMEEGEFGAAVATADKNNAFAATVTTNRPRGSDQAVDLFDLVDFDSNN